jgi:hypothetical protein
MPDIASVAARPSRDLQSLGNHNRGRNRVNRRVGGKGMDVKPVKFPACFVERRALNESHRAEKKESRCTGAAFTAVDK